MILWCLVSGFVYEEYFTRKKRQKSFWKELISNELLIEGYPKQSSNLVTLQIQTSYRFFFFYFYHIIIFMILIFFSLFILYFLACVIALGSLLILFNFENMIFIERLWKICASMNFFELQKSRWIVQFSNGIQTDIFLDT